MGLRKGTCDLHVSAHFGDGTPGAAHLASKTYTYARPGAPEDQPWGCRELRLGDPSGNKLIFYMDLPRT